MGQGTKLRPEGQTWPEKRRPTNINQKKPMDQKVKVPTYHISHAIHKKNARKVISWHLRFQWMKINK